MPPCCNIKVNTRAGKEFSCIEQQPAVQLKVTFQKKYWKYYISTDWYKYIKPFRNLCVHPTQSRLHHHLSAIVCRKVFLRISCGMSWNLFRRIWSHTLMKWKCGPPTNLNCMMKYTVKSLEGDNLKTWWTLKETGNALPFHFCPIRLNGLPDWSDITVCTKELIHAFIHAKYKPNVQASNQLRYHARVLHCFNCSADTLSVLLCSS